MNSSGNWDRKYPVKSNQLPKPVEKAEPGNPLYHKEEWLNRRMAISSCFSKSVRMLNQRHLLTIMLIACITSYGAAQTTIRDSSSSLTISDLWEKIILNSRLLNIKELELLERKEAVKDAKASKLPDLTLDGEYARLTNLPQFENGIFHSPTYYPLANTSYSLGASVYFTLYNGGHFNRRIESEKISVKIAEQQRNLTTSEIKLLAAAYYLDLLKGRAFQNLLLQDIEEQNKILLLIKAMYKNGIILKSDVLRAELKLSGQKLQIDQIKNDNAIVSQKIILLSGLADDTYIFPSPPFLPDTVQLPPWIYR